MTEKINKKPSILMGISLSVLIFILIQLMGIVILPIFYMLPFKIPSVAYGFLTIVISYVSILYLFLYRPKDKRSSFKQILSKIHFKKPTFKVFEAGFLLAFCIFVFAGVIQAILSSFLSHSGGEGQSTTNALINNHGIWVIILGIIVPMLLAPIFEESVFRGLIGHFFGVFNGGNKIVYLITESLIFGILHLQLSGSMFAMASAVGLPMFSGLIFGIIYLKTGNVAYTMVAHSTYNLLVLLTRIF